MVRGERIKFYRFAGSPDLTADATGYVDAYSDSNLNGRIQSIYYEDGNYTATGSIQIFVSGTTGGTTSTEGTILSMTSGTVTGHNLGEDWVIFPRATCYHTSGVPLSGPNGWNVFAEIPIWSTLRVVISGAGANTSPSGLTVVYI